MWAGIAALFLSLAGGDSACLRHQLVQDEEAREICEGGFESGVFESGRPFNELLVSWNVDAPEGTGFSVEIRVGRKEGDFWSPFLYVGDWGEGFPAGPRLTQFAEGRVDVDHFVSDRRFDRAQYRIRPFSAKPLRARRIALCFGDTTANEEVSAREASAARPRARRLDLPSRSQWLTSAEIAGRVCSPASVGMTMAYRGADVPTAEIAARLYDPVHDIYGNWARAIQGAYSFGVPGYLTRFCRWEEVEAEIARGNPLVVSIRAREGELNGAPYRETEGHLLVLAGFDENGDVLVGDPAAPAIEEVRRIYKRGELERAWFRNGKGTAYLFLPKEPR